MLRLGDYAEFFFAHTSYAIKICGRHGVQEHPSGKATFPGATVGGGGEDQTKSRQSVGSVQSMFSVQVLSSSVESMCSVRVFKVPSSDRHSSLCEKRDRDGGSPLYKSRGVRVGWSTSWRDK